LGWDVRPQSVVEKGVRFHNLVARRGPSGGRPLLLNTHTDTVPPGPAVRWTATGGDPFRLTRRGGFLVGLGAADVKLNLLCQIEALRRLGDVPFKRPVVIAGTFGEERGLAGARHLIKAWRGPKPALVLAGEPSEMALIHRHRGYLVFEWTLPPGPLLHVRGRVPRFDLRFEGKSAHSSTPHLGVNALERGVAFLRALTAAGFSPRVVEASGGTAHNQVPAEALFKVLLPALPGGAFKGTASKGFFSTNRPVRLLPWESLGAIAVLAGHLPASHSVNWAILQGERGRWKARFDLRFPPEDSADRLEALVRKTLGENVATLLRDPALHAPRASAEMRFLKKVLRGAGLGAKMEEKQTCTEAGLYDAWGVPAAVIGPGRSTGNVHRPNEKISLSQLAKAVRFYEALITQWINPDS
jgi:acetylornithine deacetylase/succinyl-diaminopimelate desuccinylase-like protein